MKSKSKATAEFVEKPRRLRKSRRAGTLHFHVKDSVGIFFTSTNFHECFVQMKKNPDSFIEHSWVVNSPDK